MAKLPLEGIRVVDLSTVYAAPYATMILADMGAEVIRVESIQHFPRATRGPMARPSKEFIRTLVPWAGGYPNQEPGPRAWNQCPFFNFHARNKLGMTVDLTRPEGMDIFRRLVRVSDIVVENSIPEVMEKMGMTYELLKELKSDIIVVCITAYGLSGPYKDYRNMAIEIESYLGHTLLRGYPDMELTAITDAYPSDPAAGASAAFAILAAWERAIDRAIYCREYGMLSWGGIHGLHHEPKGSKKLGQSPFFQRALRVLPLQRR